MKRGRECPPSQKEETLHDEGGDLCRARMAEFKSLPIFLCVHVSLYVCMYVCMYVNIYVGVCIYTAEGGLEA
jgi:hypothetical protein